MPDLAAKLPASLAARTRDVRLLDGRVPALLVDPIRAEDDRRKPPMLLWLHGRTVDRFLDPGRHLRLMRAGIGVCAIDLPGHGDRFDASLQRPEEVPRLIQAALDEVDSVTAAAVKEGGFDRDRLAIGGMSAGGMVTLARLGMPHPFRAAVIECSAGSWRRLPWWPLASRIAHLDPIARASTWSPIPLLALHNAGDEWIPLAAQREFIEAIRPRSADPSEVELVVYEKTGAPQEHAGFGRFAADAKDRLVAFLRRHLA